MANLPITGYPDLPNPAGTEEVVVADSPTTNKRVSITNFVKKWFSDVDANSNNLVNFGYLESNAASPADAGTVRLGYTELVEWRNSGNTGNITLTATSGDTLVTNATFQTTNGIILFVTTVINAASVANDKTAPINMPNITDLNFCVTKISPPEIEMIFPLFKLSFTVFHPLFHYLTLIARSRVKMQNAL